LGVVGEIVKKDLGDLLEVVLDTVLDDVVDRDDELVELVETLVNVLEVGVDVHGGPGKGDHTGSELVLKILKMGLEEVLGDGLDLSKNLLMLIENILELIEVHLKLLFLEKDDSSSLRDLNMLSFEALSFTDELKNGDIEVNVKRSGITFSDDQSSLESSLSSLDLLAPGSEEPLLVDLELETDGVVRG
jgi:hypothetical protein